jgi:uncharacterized protein YkwD
MIGKWLFIVFTCTILSWTKVWPQIDYYSFPDDDFRNAQVFNDTIDLNNPDTLRINAIIYYLTNEIRKKHRLNLLGFEPLLEKSATIHSGNMVKQKFFAHINPKSKKFKTPEDRARFVGVTNPFLAENIIESFVLQYTAGKEVYPDGKGIFRNKPGGSPITAHTYLSLGQSMLKAWMNSPGHRSNILSKKALQLGCGTAFFIKKDFNDMPSIVATQNFQLYEPVK